ncbi:hypothetical protein GCM10009131_04050 [Morganella psychrotolerans]
MVGVGGWEYLFINMYLIQIVIRFITVISNDYDFCPANGSPPCINVLITVTTAISYCLYAAAFAAGAEDVWWHY